MTISVIGVGLDGADGLSRRVNKIIEGAAILAGSKRHLSYFPQHQGKKVYLTNLNAGIDEIAALERENFSIVVLASGDPLFFGLGRLLLTHFDVEQIRFYPHISSIQLGFSKIKVPWQDACLVSVHGRSNERLIKLLKQGKEKIALLTDSNNNPAAIARLYLSLDLPVKYSFYICENLGDSNEKVSHFSFDCLKELKELSQNDLAALNVLILIREGQTDEIELDSLP
ncbi:MAG: precorrin-6y C5,15-methyltransferase (decarboxylating) subunit CbiE, partial [Pleurocapsa sp.]